MVQPRDWNWLPAISAEEFAEHIEEENFPVLYGNPVRIFTKNGREFICLTIELYERMFGTVDMPDEIITEYGDETE